jgi:glycosyltransferase involved in cell wall biosynthesis
MVRLGAAVFFEYKKDERCFRSTQEKVNVMCHIAIIDHVGKKAGMDCYDSSLMKGLKQHGCHATIYSNFIGIDHQTINYRICYEGHSKSNALVKLYRFVCATCMASYQARKEKTDLVIMHLFAANAVTLFLVSIPKIFGLKTAVISHDVSSFANNDSPIIKQLIYNTFADYIVVHNRFSHETLINSIQINNLSKIAIIKHGGYLDHIGQRPEKEKLRRELGFEEDGKYILFFGQIKKVKGLDILLEALGKVPDDIKLIIAGKPWKDNFSDYDELIEKYRLENRVFKMIRFIEDNEREKLFFAADVNVLPYRIIYQSGVLLMAMSHGLAVIASDLPANKEIINDGENGMLFSSEDSDDLALKIKLFFQDQSFSKKLAGNALETIKSDYDWHTISREYLRMIKR